LRLCVCLSVWAHSHGRISWSYIKTPMTASQY